MDFRAQGILDLLIRDVGRIILVVAIVAALFGGGIVWMVS